MNNIKNHNIECLFGFHDWCPSKWVKTKDGHERAYFCNKCNILHPELKHDCEFFNEDGSIDSFTAWFKTPDKKMKKLFEKKYR
jgi:hypothetical protein